MVEILCAVLSGGAMLTQVGGMRETGKPMSVSHMFLAIDVDRFMPVDEFAKRMEWVREAVTHSQPASGFDEVMIAGDPEWRTVETRSRDGVPVSAGIWHELMTLARTLNVPEPATAA
jgi:LDH2 family malate/lactate/ureidoglycolate dehydrogenase